MKLTKEVVEAIEIDSVPLWWFTESGKPPRLFAELLKETTLDLYVEITELRDAVARYFECHDKFFDSKFKQYENELIKAEQKLREMIK
jgi:hypothetical protein